MTTLLGGRPRPGHDGGSATRPAPGPPPGPPRPSSILLKVVLAVSGLVMFGYVFIHMVGNLKVYLGPESLDTYAAWLRDHDQ